MLCHKVLGPVILAALLSATATPAFAFDETKYPDWSGWWRVIGGNRWDATKPQRRGQNAPLTAEYQAIFEASIADQDAGGQGNDFRYRCLPAGMPRVMTAIFPFEFVILPDLTYILFESAMPRRIFTDGRDFSHWPKPDAEPAFVGYSIGKWIDEDGDGRYDMLEVETRHIKGPRAMDQSGLPLHEDNATIVKERLYRDKTDTIAARRCHHHRRRLHPALDGEEDFSPRTRRSGLGRKCLRRGQQLCGDRQGGLLPQRRRQSDAGQEGSGAAGSAVFHSRHGAEMTV